MTNSTRKPVALVTGVGPGTGAAISRRFAKGGYAVAMLARNRERLGALEKEIAGARGFACDVTDEATLDATLGRPSAVSRTTSSSPRRRSPRKCGTSRTRSGAPGRSTSR